MSHVARVSIGDDNATLEKEPDMRVVTRTRPTLHFSGAMTRLLWVFWCVVFITFLASVSYAVDLLVPAESFETDGQKGAGNRYLSN